MRRRKLILNRSTIWLARAETGLMTDPPGPRAKS
jgi:hypothetical protein